MVKKTSALLFFLLLLAGFAPLAGYHVHFDGPAAKIIQPTALDHSTLNHYPAQAATPEKNLLEFLLDSAPALDSSKNPDVSPKIAETGISVFQLVPKPARYCILFEYPLQRISSQQSRLPTSRAPPFRS